MEKIYQSYQQLELTLKKDNIKPTYEELLNTQEWRNFRNIILRRDYNRCTRCKQDATEYGSGKHIRNFTDEERRKEAIRVEEDYQSREPDPILGMKYREAPRIGIFVEKPIFMHARHKFYIYGKLPWEYRTGDLIILCNNCHFDFHKNNKVAYYKDVSLQEKLNLNECPRCNGAGHFEEYSHIQGGVCFTCRGAKYIEFINQYRVG